MMGEDKCCCTCIHCIRRKDKGGNISTCCELDNHYIGYIACFERRCAKWELDPWQKGKEQ